MNNNGIDIKSFLEKLKNESLKIIDLRLYSDYLVDHIPSSIHIDINNLVNKPSLYLNKNMTYFLYCDNGKKSMKVSRYLNSLGFDTVNVLGGFNNYLMSK